jgi:hypothetical protein
MADSEAEAVRQSWQRRYRVPEQETKLHPVTGLNVATEDGLRNATLAEHDQRAGSALVRFSKRHFEVVTDTPSKPTAGEPTWRHFGPSKRNILKWIPALLFEI